MPEVYFAHPDYGYARDFRGYGEAGLPTLKWPDNAKIAISFVINYEEVGRDCQRLIPNIQLTSAGGRAVCTQWRRSQ